MKRQQVAWRRVGFARGQCACGALPLRLRRRHHLMIWPLTRGAEVVARRRLGG